MQNNGDTYQVLDGSPRDPNLYFMKDPVLYKIGLNGKCISTKIFIYWIIYGMTQSFVIYFISIQVLCELGMTSPDGKEEGIWLCGHLAFGLSVIVANIVILMKYNIHHIGSLSIIGLMVMMYFATFAFESQFLLFTQIFLLFR